MRNDHPQGVGAPSGTGSRPAGRASKAVSPVPASIPSAVEDWDDELLIQRSEETVAIVNEHGKLGELTAPYAAILLRAHVWRLKALLEALEPFALLYGEDDEDFADDAPVTVQYGRTKDYSLVLADIRRAVAALRASAIEARRAETSGSVEDESAAPAGGDAQ